MKWHYKLPWFRHIATEDILPALLFLYCAATAPVVMNDVGFEETLAKSNEILFEKSCEDDMPMTMSIELMEVRAFIDDLSDGTLETTKLNSNRTMIKNCHIISEKPRLCVYAKSCTNNAVRTSNMYASGFLVTRDQKGQLGLLLKCCLLECSVLEDCTTHWYSLGSSLIFDSSKTANKSLINEITAVWYWPFNETSNLRLEICSYKTLDQRHSPVTCSFAKNSVAKTMPKNVDYEPIESKFTTSDATPSQETYNAKGPLRQKAIQKESTTKKNREVGMQQNQEVPFASDVLARANAETSELAMPTSDESIEQIQPQQESAVISHDDRSEESNESDESPKKDDAPRPSSDEPYELSEIETLDSEHTH